MTLILFTRSEVTWCSDSHMATYNDRDHVFQQSSHVTDIGACNIPTRQTKYLHDRRLLATLCYVSRQHLRTLRPDRKFVLITFTSNEDVDEIRLPTLTSASKQDQCETPPWPNVSTGKAALPRNKIYMRNRAAAAVSRDQDVDGVKSTCRSGKKVWRWLASCMDRHQSRSVYFSHDLSTPPARSQSCYAACYHIHYILVQHILVLSTYRT